MNKRQWKKRKKFAQARMAVIFGDAMNYRLHQNSWADRIFLGAPATKPGYVLLTARQKELD